MAKTVFNPDDFVFEKLSLPEDNPTLIEYDAKNRLIYVRMQNPDKSYEYNAVYLTESVNNNLLNNFPDKWSNENDRILLFAVHENGKVLFEKEKLKYNFDKQETYWVRYEQNDLSTTEAKEIFDILKAAVFVQNAKNETERDNALISLAKQDFYLDKMYLALLHTSEKWLRETDWRILPDAPQSFEGEMNLWKIWRDKVRSCVCKPEDFETPLDFLIWQEEFRWPINPEKYHKLYPDHDVEYLSTPDQFVLEDVSVTEQKMDLINEELNATVRKLKYDQEHGIPITKEMHDIIRRYSLLDNVENVKLNVGEEQ